MFQPGLCPKHLERQGFDEDFGLNIRKHKVSTWILFKMQGKPMYRDSVWTLRAAPGSHYNSLWLPGRTLLVFCSRRGFCFKHKENPCFDRDFVQNIRKTTLSTGTFNVSTGILFETWRKTRFWRGFRIKHKETLASDLDSIQNARKTNVSG